MVNMVGVMTWKINICNNDWMREYNLNIAKKKVLFFSFYFVCAYLIAPQPKNILIYISRSGWIHFFALTILEAVRSSCIYYRVLKMIKPIFVVVVVAMHTFLSLSLAFGLSCSLFFLVGWLVVIQCILTNWIWWSHALTIKFLLFFRCHCSQSSSKWNWKKKL